MCRYPRCASIHFTDAITWAIRLDIELDVVGFEQDGAKNHPIDALEDAQETKIFTGTMNQSNKRAPATNSNCLHMSLQPTLSQCPTIFSRCR